MRSSLMGLSAARQTLTSRNRTVRTALILFIIFSGHCTPVQGVEKGGLLAPPGLYAHMQVEIDLRFEELLHLLAGEGADLFEHRALGADDDGLLAVTLHADGSVNARERSGFLPPVHHYGDGVGHLLAGG